MNFIKFVSMHDVTQKIMSPRIIQFTLYYNSIVYKFCQNL